MTDDHHGRSTRLDAVVREQGIDAPAGESPASVSDSGAGPRVAHVPKPHVHDTFSVEGIDTKRREGLLEAVLRDCDGVSAASATARNDTVGVHHDPSVSRGDLQEMLEACGLVVDPADRAFEIRRASQFASARVAVAVLFGLMVATPYIAVLYPTRLEWLFYDPLTVAYLQSLLDSQMATHFFVNLGALSGIAFLVACGPMIKRSLAAAAAGRVTNESVFVASVTALFAYSTAAAFTGFDGVVHYDLVAYAVVGATLWTHFGAADPAAEGRGAVDADASDGDIADNDPVAMTDGGR
ncbi:hypothetical protein [Halorubrum lacusprofundi]|jgi:cation transport ATPase|uniref:HMA domain-containing protein n=1 Tax=Halorubrum lacusprofundi (strain ATCC 49239 / DSM 5036 / JCM 8891 / ACAM 34) TaxID=416348 RepID=B9LR97_HALLT|nr:hypothetical protein [Halorubrum lacusprofundi]ACM57751.1 hypothetical protein Hlac_2174 [Halorubrum lacusprofundi ATCC 49239]MCG1007092.1 hypothetical protein [Halorubrum lacusprofundi]